VADDTDLDGLPIDPDVIGVDDQPFGPGRGRPPRVHLRLGILAAIAAGGFVGGIARYEIARAFPSTVAEFPWSTFAVNVSGAFGLALLLVLALEVWRPTRYLRPAIGTGFFGAYTTWSTYMVQTDQLISHHQPGIAAAYLLGSAAAGLAAAAAGLLLGRRVFLQPRHRNVTENGS